VDFRSLIRGGQLPHVNTESRSATASSYGAAGALIVLMLWVYYSAQIFLLGAEFIKACANRHGSKRQEPVAETGTTYMH
jgi:uncharacterized BrkB/YihY/UPF0761 family membrane protein